MKKEVGFSLIGIAVFVLIVIAVAIVAIAALGQMTGILLFSKPCIAEVRVDDFISDSAGEESIFSPAPPPTSHDIINMLDEANSRDDIKAIVLYIDSPGGEVIASREIYESVRDSKKPVVAYFRNVAASGGYYAAAGADYIISEPETITGSIGVRVSTLSLAGLFNTLGINYTTIASGDKKDMGDIGRNLTEQEGMLLKEFIDEVFSNFRDDVYEGRKGHARFSRNGLNEVLDGRIISGRKAYSLGLVDELGNDERAYEKAAELANVSDNYEKCPLSKQKGIFQSFMESALSGLNINVNIGGIGSKERVIVSYT